LHQPGPGVGGHCIAVDPWFVAEKHPDLARIITLARNTNDQMPMYVYMKIKKILGDLKGKSITILGMTYKADTDDIRESPIIELVHLLEDVQDINIRIYDPLVKSYKYLENDIELATTNCDLLVLGVNHKCLRELDYAYIREQMSQPVILDTRNALEREALEALGYKYLLLRDGLNG